MDPLAAPALLEPAHLRIFIDTRTPEFTWQPVENASYYKIQISKSSLFDTFVQKTTVYAGDDPVSYVAATLPNGKYYWRVRAFDSSNGKGPWSVVRVFKIKIP